METEKRYGFFHDNKGNLSSKRLMALICLVVGIILAFAWVVIIIFVKPLDRVTIPSFVEVIMIFIGSALALQGVSLVQEIGTKPKAENKKEEKNVTV